MEFIDWVGKPVLFATTSSEYPRKGDWKCLKRYDVENSCELNGHAKTKTKFGEASLREEVSL